MSDPTKFVEMNVDPRLKRVLKNFEPRVAKKHIRAAARPAMKPILRMTKTNTPKRTGQLRRSWTTRSLSYRSKAQRRKHKGIIGVRVTTRPGSPALEYANVVEFGRQEYAPFEGIKMATRAFEKGQWHAQQKFFHELWKRTTN